MSVAETLTERRLAKAAPQSQAGVIEQVLIKGDLKALTEDQRNAYYMRVCESAGLNPLTQPFAYIVLNGKLTLYALRSATDQLRAVHGVSVVDMDEQDRDGVHIVTVKVTDRHGRSDMARGAVSVQGLKGEALANAIMKAETKAKRRATLSICGLGLLDETEVETIPGAHPLAPEAAGEDSPTSQPRQQRRSNVIINPKSGKPIDTENARNQRPEWDRFTDKVQWFTDDRDAEGLRAWFTSDDIAAFVAGWVFKDQAEEHFESALELIAERERTAR